MVPSPSLAPVTRKAPFELAALLLLNPKSSLIVGT